MFWQRETFRSGVAMPLTQTYEVDLPKSGRLGSIVMRLSATENAAAISATARKWRLVDYISKVELIGDGSEVIKSFDGLQALGSAFYDDLRQPVGIWRADSSLEHVQYVPLHLGRWFRDAAYDLDLSRFNQVTLKVTNDATGTEFSTDISIDILLFWKREWPAASQGYFREEEWKRWAPVAGGIEYSDLPVLLPIRRVLLRARPAVDSADALNKGSMHELMADIEYTLRTGQVRVFKGSLANLGHLSVMEWGAGVTTMGRVDRTTAYGVETGVGFVTDDISGDPNTDTDAIDPSEDSSQLVLAAPTTDEKQFLVRGHGYMHNVPLHVATAGDLSDVLMPDAEKVVKVDITTDGGATVAGTDRNAENAIILSRLVR